MGWWRIFASLLVALAAAPPAAAQDWPTRPVRIVTPYPPGASNDIVSRLLADQLARSLGQSVVVENKPGGGTAIGTRLAAQAAPDGYTLLFGTSAIVGNIHVLKDPQYKLDDFVLLSPMGRTSYTMLVSSRLPVRTLAEFVALAKQRPGVLNFGSFSRGGMAELLAERLNRLAGIEMVEIMYKGGAEALQGVMAGQIHVYFATIALTMQHVESPELRALGITSDQRSPLLPQVPTFAEQDFPEMLGETWFAVFAPVATPAPIVAKLQATLAEIAAEPAMVERLAKLGATPWEGSLESFAAYMKEDERRIAEDIRRLGLKLE